MQLVSNLQIKMQTAILKLIPNQKKNEYKSPFFTF